MTRSTPRSDRLERLGPLRLRILSCLGGDMPSLEQYFDPQPDEDVASAFREFVGQMLLRWEHSADPLTLSLLGAGRLLTGDIRAARTIIDHLPEKLVTLDHGAGRCLVAGASTLRAALPLPSGLAEVSRWLASSAEQAALRTWLAQNEAQLVWDELRAEYVLTPDTGAG